MFLMLKGLIKNRKRFALKKFSFLVVFKLPFFSSNFRFVIALINKKARTCLPYISFEFFPNGISLPNVLVILSKLYFLFKR